MNTIGEAVKAGIDIRLTGKSLFAAVALSVFQAFAVDAAVAVAAITPRIAISIFLRPAGCFVFIALLAERAVFLLGYAIAGKLALAFCVARLAITATIY